MNDDVGAHGPLEHFVNVAKTEEFQKNAQVLCSWFWFPTEEKLKKLRMLGEACTFVSL